MEPHGSTLHHDHQAIIERFVEVCQSDERVIAAFLRGSHAKGVTDEYSNLDLSLITTDESYNNFVTEREAFLRFIDEPIFFKDSDYPNLLFFTFADE